MIYVFDLDFTLLDTKKLLLDLPKAMGISPRVYNSTRDKYFPELLFTRKYSGYKHINYLKRDGYIMDGVRAREKVRALFKNMDKYLYSGAEDLLCKLKKRKNKLILLTFGDNRWQKAKVNGLSIKQHFNRIIITDKNKGSVLKFLKKSRGQALIINDNARENIAIKKALGDSVRTILVKSPHSKNIRHNMKEFSFNELLRILQ
ncbi:MAG: HAD hydrolase-like protein [Candidatus Falkowbacteria bacterium]